MHELNELIVIHIKGIYKKDVALRIIEETTPLQESTYDVMPNKYTGLEYWIKKTNILCANCCLKHDNMPVFIPEYFTQSGINLVDGDTDDLLLSEASLINVLFCSFPCAATYISINYRGDDADHKMNALRFIYEQFTGYNIDYIPLAPHKEEIDCFGGRSAPYTAQLFKCTVNKLIPISNYLIYSE